MYPSYLIHFNRQHDPKTGKFTFGDGDGDGVHNDHKNQRTKGYSRREDGTDGRNSSSERNRRSETAANRAHNDRYSGGGGRISGTSVSKPSYTKVPGDPINRTKPTYDKNVWGSVPKYKPTYDKVGPAKGGNKTSETIGNMNATLSRNFTRTNEKEHLYGPSGYDYNAPPSNGSTKYDAEQRNNSNTLKDADYYLRNNKLTNPIENGKKLVDSAKDREVDTQKVTNKEATEIFVMRALGQTLNSLYIDDDDERRAKNKELLEITNTKNWNK